MLRLLLHLRVGGLSEGYTAHTYRHIIADAGGGGGSCVLLLESGVVLLDHGGLVLVVLLLREDEHLGVAVLHGGGGSGSGVGVIEVIVGDVGLDVEVVGCVYLYGSGGGAGGENLAVDGVPGGAILPAILLAVGVLAEVLVEVTLEWRGVAGYLAPLGAVPDRDSRVRAPIVAVRVLLLRGAAHIRYTEKWDALSSVYEYINGQIEWRAMEYEDEPKGLL